MGPLLTFTSDHYAMDRKSPRVFQSHSRSRTLVQLPLSPHVSYDLSGLDYPASHHHHQHPHHYTSRRSPTAGPPAHKALFMARHCCPSLRFFTSAVLASAFVILFCIAGLATFAPAASTSIRSFAIGSRAFFAPPLAATPASAASSVWDGYNEAQARHVFPSDQQPQQPQSQSQQQQKQQLAPEGDAPSATADTEERLRQSETRAQSDGPAASDGTVVIGQALTDTVQSEEKGGNNEADEKPDRKPPSSQEVESSQPAEKRGENPADAEPLATGWQQNDSSSQSSAAEGDAPKAEDTSKRKETEQSPVDASNVVPEQEQRQQKGQPPGSPTADTTGRDPADFSTFTSNTALNYFHLHKTGGVSFKERLFDFFYDPERVKPSGSQLKVVDTCHDTGPSRPALGIESVWSCDWGEIERMPEEQRQSIDMVVGHQYWDRGAGHWVPGRDLRYFTVMRHPLHRKISFYYHFFVRNTGRTEKSVSTEELINFVLARKVPDSPLARDAGPAYYASRLWSDGVSGFENNAFKIAAEDREKVVENSIRRLRRNFVFIGLQSQERASLCMLRETVRNLAKAHGISKLRGLEAIGKQRERMNTGSYGLSADILWSKMSIEQKEEFKRVEEVDLAIYRESVKMFGKNAKRFNCEDLVEEREDDDIALT